MSSIKLIEDLDQTTSLSDSDLLMTSTRNSNGSYTSKKMTLNALADYVNSRESGGVTGFGGYEIIDTTEDEDGVYETETAINEYMQNQNKNYLWRFKVGTSAPAGISVLEKQVHKDCKVFIQLVNNELSNDIQQVYINDVRIYTWPLSIGNNNLGRVLYVKKNQTLKIISTQLTPTVTILSLKSGGEFFFDTDSQDVFKSGFYNPGTNPPTETTGNNFVSNGWFTYTASCPTMVCTTNGATYSLNNDPQPTLNGKPVHITSLVHGNGLKVFLDKNDTISCAFPSNVISYYGIYPLLVV